MHLSISKVKKHIANIIFFKKNYHIWEFFLIFAASKYKTLLRMKVIFRDIALSELYETGKTKDRKYKQICKNKKLIDGYIKVVSIMYDVDSTEDLKPFSFLHYEKLKYQRDEPKSSVRLVNGMVERLLFVETDDGIEVELIEIDSTHYGNKK
jgi:hypothetical protein